MTTTALQTLVHWIQAHPVPSVVAIVVLVVGAFAWAIRQTAYRYR